MPDEDIRLREVNLPENELTYYDNAKTTEDVLSSLKERLSHLEGPPLIKGEDDDYPLVFKITVRVEEVEA